MDCIFEQRGASCMCSRIVGMCVWVPAGLKICKCCAGRQTPSCTISRHCRRNILRKTVPRLTSNVAIFLADLAGLTPDAWLVSQELERMEEVVGKVKADAKRSATDKAAALEEVSKLEALVAQLKQQQPQSKGLDESTDKVCCECDLQTIFWFFLM